MEGSRAAREETPALAIGNAVAALEELDLMFLRALTNKI
jgi:hypothetical protein